MIDNRELKNKKNKKKIIYFLTHIAPDIFQSTIPRIGI